MFTPKIDKENFTNVDWPNKQISDKLKKMIEYPFDDWLEVNTKRKSLRQWIHKERVYDGLDSLRRIWLIEILR